MVTEGSSVLGSITLGEGFVCPSRLGFGRKVTSEAWISVAYLITPSSVCHLRVLMRPST